MDPAVWKNALKTTPKWWQEIRPLSGIDFDYAQESVEWLGGTLERLRNSGEFENVEMKDKLASVLGFFSVSALPLRWNVERARVRNVVRGF